MKIKCKCGGEIEIPDNKKVWVSLGYEEAIRDMGDYLNKLAVREMQRREKQK